jgi:hypothetical protein
LVCLPISPPLNPITPRTKSDCMSKGR